MLFNAAEPWISDGTESGTCELADINSGPFVYSNPADFKKLGSKIYFTANDGVNSGQWMPQ
jgi:ELWxxDGT repeat protein